MSPLQPYSYICSSPTFRIHISDTRVLICKPEDPEGHELRVPHAPTPNLFPIFFVSPSRASFVRLSSKTSLALGQRRLRGLSSVQGVRHASEDVISEIWSLSFQEIILGCIYAELCNQIVMRKEEERTWPSWRYLTICSRFTSCCPSRNAKVLNASFRPTCSQLFLYFLNMYNPKIARSFWWHIMFWHAWNKFHRI